MAIPSSLTSGRGRGLARTAVVGLVAGFLSGMFGVGGGILIVPALVLVLGLDQRLANGTSLAAVLPIAASGLVAYAVEGEVDWPVALALAIGAVGGAVIGTYVLHLLPVRVLTAGFTVLLIATAVRMLFDHSTGDGRAELGVAGVLLLVAVGVAAGVLAGLLGVGGGIIMVPAMVVLFGMPGVLARGTSLAVILPTSISGTLRNRTRGNADLRAAAVVGIAGVVSSFPAGLIATRLDEQLANALFAGLLVLVALKMIWDLRRSGRRNDQVVAGSRGK